MTATAPTSSRSSTQRYLDGERVGVMGGSYGGFMTTWLAAHHGERFTAAISERALNAPTASSTQALCVALKLRGVPTEMVVFPGEGHELSRSGLPSHRVARFGAILEWWARWMPVDR